MRLIFFSLVSQDDSREEQGRNARCYRTEIQCDIPLLAERERSERPLREACEGLRLLIGQELGG